MRYLLIILGSFLNRVRGGLFDNLPCNKLYFPLYVGGLLCYSMGWDLQLFITGFLACYLGQQIVGWGAYVGCLTTGFKPHAECDMIDEVINACRITLDGKVYKLIDYPRCWGFCGLTIRGLVWSLPIGLVNHSLLTQLSGLTMGIAYLIPTIILWKTKYHEGKYAWNVGEWIFGGILTSAILWG